MDERAQNFALSLCVLRHVTKTSRKVVSAWDRALKPAGLTGMQFNILATLAGSGDLNVRSLAAIVGMDATTVPRAIAPLVREHLLAVRPGKDARERIIHLTPRGKAKFASAKSRWQTVQQSVLDSFGGSDWKSLVALLRRLRGAISS